MQNALKTFGVLGASRIGHNPAEAIVMRDIGRALALNNRTVHVGCVTGQILELLHGVVERGGEFVIHLIPDQQPKSVENCEQFGFEFFAVDRDNTRTLNLLNCDAWVSGYMSTGSIGETARGATWNQDRGIRTSEKTPHFYLGQSETNRLLLKAYEAAVKEGRADEHVVRDLFIKFSDADELIRKIAQYENGSPDQAMENTGLRHQKL